MYVYFVPLLDSHDQIIHNLKTKLFNEARQYFTVTLD